MHTDECHVINKTRDRNRARGRSKKGCSPTQVFTRLLVFCWVVKQQLWCVADIPLPRAPVQSVLKL